MLLFFVVVFVSLLFVCFYCVLLLKHGIVLGFDWFLSIQASSQSGSSGQNTHLIQRILEQIEQKPLSVASRHTRVRKKRERERLFYFFTFWCFLVVVVVAVLCVFFVFFCLFVFVLLLLLLFRMCVTLR